VSAAARPRARRIAPPLPADAALFLDVDGTLLDIASAPNAVMVPDGLVATLRRLNAALGGAVALVSGRREAELRKFFPRAGLILVAEHGAAASVPMPAGWGRKRVPAAAVKAFADFAAQHQGALFEDKRHGAALHVRRAPAAAEAARRLARRLAAAHRGHVRLIEGRAVFELVQAGISKGHAIEALMQRAPFRGRLCVVAGDDVTDEDGFAIANRLGGVSLRIAGRPAGDVASAAHFVLPHPAALRAWLGEAAARLRDSEPSSPRNS